MRNASALAECEVQGGCYGVQVLVAGRRKRWRDEVSTEIKRAGYNATTVDSGVDALTILALGVPMDVLVTDAELHGDLRCSRLAVEARALRPNLAIIFASHAKEVVDCVPDALVVSPDAKDGTLTGTVREALQARA
ncbi:histidine kinase [Methylobacterium gnaphalii]|uniref:Response regulatory domain-containing protein n=1 Tax=Methylobacterium gnaphalii TaxID=1010610 RepID=A0A512JLZ1_9HYPH|nr:histidine kinase [Methylobacterium gnaphalii]GEP10981.1 hypothetical protein MGN01_28260 [Methylobacterium gnaphalii]GJD69759.1 hypothetical protein MMMDOFMJ_2697 [Methylobacterium gnaphalii]GLS50260.1 hypothetical protein GCM10007885_31120 [Methylobacterium gnaphalii]